MKKIVKKPSSLGKKSLPVNVVKKPKENVRMHVLTIGNVLAFLAVIVVNYLAVTLPIGGMTTGALSDLYPNLFTPAGLTFSIWGLIYLMVFGFVIRQIIDFYKKKSSGITTKI